MDSPSLYQALLDELIAFASKEGRKPDLLAAKADYFQHTGEIFEDDKTFELRMASFLDYYVFDRPSPTTGKTPAQEFLEAETAASNEERLGILRAFTATHHGLFEVRKIGKGGVRLRDLFLDKDFEVTERRHIAGLEKGDVLEARLIPYHEHLLFSAAFCYHPREAVKSIKKEIKRRKKKEPERTARELVWEAAKRAVKAERYRQIAVEKIYDFENSKL